MTSDPIEDQFFVALQALQQLQDASFGDPLYAIVESWIDRQQLSGEQFGWLNDRVPSRRTQIILAGGQVQRMRNWDYFTEFKPESENSEKTLRRAVYYFIEVVSASLDARRPIRIRRCPQCRSFFVQSTARKKFCEDWCRVSHNNEKKRS